MNIKTMFYALGTVVFALMLVFMIGTGILFLLIFKKVNQLQKTLTQVVEHATKHPGEVIVEAGSALISKAMKKMGSKRKK